MAQDVDVRDGLPAAGDQDRDIDEDLPPIMFGVNPHRVTAPDNACVRPTRSASSRVATFPA